MDLSYLYVSCRKDVYSTMKFSGRIDVIDPAGLEPLPLSSIRKVPTLVFVHGYRGTWDSVAEGYRESFEMFWGLAGTGAFRYQQIIGFYWPGSWDAFFGYLRAEWRTTEAGRQLAELCELLGEDYVLTGHSLGCRVIAEAMLYGALPSKVLMLGPAIKHTAYNLGERFYDCRRVPHSILYSRHDPVLRTPFRWAHLGTKALGCVGPQLSAVEVSGGGCWPDFQGVDVTDYVNRHSGYRRTHHYFQALRDLKL